MTDQNPMDVLQKEAPEVAATFDQFIESLIRLKGLDPKTKQLVYIGIKSAQGETTAVQFHVPMAKKLGATREEIRDTILVTLSTSGLNGVVSCLPMALRVYDEGP
jgi:alkylhydroperoxidase/carboxymuconolactone decarboxylase family protein YurZ